MGESVDIVVSQTGADQAAAGMASLSAAADKAASSIDKSNSSIDGLKATANAAASPVDNLSYNASKASIALQQMQANSKNSADGLKQMAEGTTTANVALGAFLGSLAAGIFEEFIHSIKEVVSGYREMADEFTGIVNRLKLVSSSSQELVDTEEKLFEVANRTRGSFAETANLYAKVALSADNLGIAAKDLIPTVETVNEIIAISGANSTQAKNGLFQFAEGLEAGTFSGIHLKALLMDLPLLGKSIAQGLGTTTAGLREMGKQGQLSAKVVLDALAKTAPDIAKQFAQMTPTIGGALTVLKNNTLQLVGVFDQLHSASSTIASIILVVANNLANFAKGVAVALSTVVAFYTGLAIQTGWQAFSAAVFAANARLLAYVAAAELAGVQTTILGRLLVVFQTPVAALTTAFRALWVAILANPIVAVVAALGAAAAAVYFFGNQVKITADGSINLFGAVVGTLKYMYTWLQTLGTFMSTVFGPVFTAIGNGIAAVWGTVWGIVKKVVEVLASFIPQLQPLAAGLNSLGATWIQAMKDASKNTEDATLAAKDFGKVGSDSMNSVGAAAEAMNEKVKLAGDGMTQLGRVVASAIPPFENLVIAQKKLEDQQKQAKILSDAYTKSIKDQQQEIEKLALVTQNAMGEMVTATDEWARRSGAAFNQIKDGASATANAVENSMDQIVSSADKASSSIQSTADKISAQSTYLPDQATVQSSFQALGGNNWGEIGNALLVFNNLYGHPGGDTATLHLWKLLSAEPKEAAHSFVQNYAYVNTGFASAGLPTFATGGDFAVGGSGGTDSQLVQFMASPDEKVLVETPAQRRARLEASQVGQGRGHKNVIVNMNVTTPDANSFRRSKQQTYLALRSKLSGATR